MVSLRLEGNLVANNYHLRPPVDFIALPSVLHTSGSGVVKLCGTYPWDRDQFFLNPTVTVGTGVHFAVIPRKRDKFLWASRRRRPLFWRQHSPAVRI